MQKLRCKTDIQKLFQKFLSKRKSNRSKAIAMNLPSLRKFPKDILDKIMRKKVPRKPSQNKFHSETNHFNLSCRKVKALSPCMRIASFSPFRSTESTTNNFSPSIKCDQLSKIVAASPEIINMYKMLNTKVLKARRSRFESFISPKVLKVKALRDKSKDFTTNNLDFKSPKSISYNRL